MKLGHLFAGLALAAVAGAAQAADPVEGHWVTQGGGARIKVAPCAADKAKMCGTIAWVKAAPGATPKDDNNPDTALRARPLVGLSMIRDFKPSGAGKWTGGKIYNPSNGKTYVSKMSANPDGTLKVEGCVAVICQAQTWKRAS
ncbi:DUF2147 domain-containing protein [Phenylobacterium sp.]|uniref:DUF2147 domain-containing protein n=1 Tax=Phenylobacterium sp. TaxID=1871053 RepID=UPI002732F27D|nr:DUF2147 domain-containing protein [Phenylobacterium sp.]MDP3853849.1 DUF2147 domain-containing protein [Phenylobacterium sp.]